MMLSLRTAALTKTQEAELEVEELNDLPITGVTDNRAVGGGRVSP